jgi:hypothetical protein
MPPPIDCRSCGVCCFSALAEYVRVTGADWARLGESAGRWAHFIGHRAYMKMQDGHCAALEVRASPKGGVDFFCMAYERRPQVCRDLGRGTPSCAGEIEAKGERVAEWVDGNDFGPAASFLAGAAADLPVRVGVAAASTHHGLAH